MTEKKRELIKTIAVIPSNLEHIAKTGIINGTLLVEIERVMEAYAAQQSKMAPESIAEGKVLMYGNIIVDSIMLPDGIYGTKLPRLYPFDETIEHMIETGKMFRDKTGTEWLPDSYFDNLTKCELRDVVVVFPKQQSKIPTEGEIDFGGHVKAKIEISDNKPVVVAAMNGWGNAIPISEIALSGFATK